MGTTANRAYAYPASTDSVQLWTHFQTLADDIDADVEDLENDLTVWTTYSPLLYQHMTTTPASITRTVNDGRYITRGGLCIAHIDVSATASSSGGCGLQLPVTGATRLITCAFGGVFGASPPSQSGTLTMSTGKTEVIPVSFTNGFVDVVSGQDVRATVIYAV